MTRAAAVRTRPAAAVAVDPVIIALDTLLAIAACGRSGFQLLTEAGEAPLAYGLSAVAAGFYAVASLTLRRAATSTRAAHAAAAICAAELAGVLLVGTLTLSEPHLFPKDTVWSLFGEGYGYAPLLLPGFALAALRRGAAGRSRASAPGA